MNKLLITVLTIACLSACDSGKPEIKNEPTNSASQIGNEAAQSHTPLSNALTSVISKDNKISFLPDDEFEDKLGDTAFMPTDVPADSVTLLQYDIGRNLTISATNQGKIVDDQFFTNLKKNIESNQSLTDVKVSEPANNQISYSFSNGDNHEACITSIDVHHDKEVTSICATSSTLSNDELQNWLNTQIKFN